MVMILSFSVPVFGQSASVALPQLISAASVQGPVKFMNGNDYKYIGPVTDGKRNGYGWYKWTQTNGEYIGHFSSQYGLDGLGVYKLGEISSQGAAYYVGVWANGNYSGPLVALDKNIKPIWIREYKDGKAGDYIVNNANTKDDIDVNYDGYRIHCIPNQTQVIQMVNNKAVAMAHIYSGGYIYVGERTNDSGREGYGVGYWFGKSQLEIGKFINNALGSTVEIWNTNGSKS
jgi:hypothetical protein